MLLLLTADQWRILLGIFTTLGAGAGVAIGWVLRNGGLKAFREWLRGLETKVKTEAFSKITRGLLAVQKPDAGPNSADELVAGLDEVRRSNERAASRTSSFARGFWTSVALVAVIAAAWAGDQLEPGEKDITHALVVISGLFSLYAIWCLAPLARAISENGVPKAQEPPTVAASGAVRADEAALAPSALVLPPPTEVRVPNSSAVNGDSSQPAVKKSRRKKTKPENMRPPDEPTGSEPR